MRSSSISRSSVIDRRLELHALHVVLARHRDLHHAAAGFAHDFQKGDLGLHLLHVGLHGLGLLHHVADISAHAGSLCVT